MFLWLLSTLCIKLSGTESLSFIATPHTPRKFEIQGKTKVSVVPSGEILTKVVFSDGTVQYLEGTFLKRRLWYDSDVTFYIRAASESCTVELLQEDDYVRQFTETTDDSYEDMPDPPVIIRDGYGEKERVDSTSFTVALVVSGVLLLSILITGRQSVTSYSNWVAVPKKEKITEDVS